MFKSTGIVRRIDDLGRISIPKIIRKKYRIHENDAIEICEGEKSIELRKYNILDDFEDSMRMVLQSFYKITKAPVIMCNRDYVLESKGARTEVKGKVTEKLHAAMIDKTLDVRGEKVTDDSDVIIAEIIKLTTGNEVIGSLIIPKTEEIVSELQKSSLQLCAEIIAIYLN